MDKSTLINFIDTNDETEIYYKYLIGQEVWYFDKTMEGSSSNYDDFKKFISLKLEIPFNNISVVGTAKTRYSFSPTKKFKEFDETSQIIGVSV